MLFETSIRDLPRNLIPLDEVIEARKRVALKRFLRKFGVILPHNTETDTIRNLVISIRDNRKKG